jgi:hypothetical protein
MPDKDFTYKFQIDVDQSGAKTATGTLTQLSQATDKAAQATTKAAKAAQQYTVCQREYVAMSRKAAQLQKEIAAKQQELDKTLQLQAMAQQDRDKALQESSNTMTATLVANADRQIAASGKTAREYAKQGRSLTNVGTQAMAVAGQFSQANSTMVQAAKGVSNVLNGFVQGGVWGASAAFAIEAGSAVVKVFDDAAEEEKRHQNDTIKHQEERIKKEEDILKQMTLDDRLKRIVDLTANFRAQIDDVWAAWKNINVEHDRYIKSLEEEASFERDIINRNADEALAELDADKTITDDQKVKERNRINKERREQLQELDTRLREEEIDLLQQGIEQDKETLELNKKNTELLKGINVRQLQRQLREEQLADAELRSAEVPFNKQREALYNYLQSGSSRRAMTKTLEDTDGQRNLKPKALKKMFKANRNYGDNWWVDWRDYVTGGMSYLERDFRRYSDAKEKRDDARDRVRAASKARRESITNARSIVTEAGFGAEAEQLTDEDFAKWLEANLEIIKEALQKGKELKESIDSREDRLKRLIKANDRQKVLNKRDNKIANITDQTAEREAKERENAERQREEKEAKRERESLRKQILDYKNSHADGKNGGYTEERLAELRRMLDSLDKSGKSNYNFNVAATNAINAMSDKIGVFTARTDNLTNQVKKTTQQLNRK